MISDLRESIVSSIEDQAGADAVTAAWTADDVMGVVRDHGWAWQDPMKVQVDREAAEAALRVLEEYPLLRDAHAATSLREALAARPAPVEV